MITLGALTFAVLKIQGFRENGIFQKYREHKLSRMDQYRIFRVFYFREWGQNPRKPRMLMPAKVNAPKVFRILTVLMLIR